MSSIISVNSPVRIFAFSGIMSMATLLGILFGVGSAALGTTLILSIIEITFSFDNAIINAKVLSKVSQFWQTIFLSVGIVVAIFGMRIIFPIAIVSLTAHLSWSSVIDLAIHHPLEYSHHLDLAHPTIAAFGGSFLLMLALQFFFRDEHEDLWLKKLERQFRKIRHWSGAPLVAIILIGAVAIIPANHNSSRTLIAGLSGAATYIMIQVLVRWLEHLQPKASGVGIIAKQVGVTAFTTLIYLEILDASFSFDGVIGAFAISSDVLLIAAGLGIGALWVRSITVFMVRRGTLNSYIFLEHGAHYTVLVLAFILLLGIIIHIPDFIPGIAGIGIIAASIAASIRFRRHGKNEK
jgi:hypothetical protein